MGIFWVCCFVLPLKCAFMGGVLPWRLLICDPMDRDWGDHPGECGYVTPGVHGPVCCGHPGDCGSVTPGTGSRKWGHPGDVHM